MKFSFLLILILSTQLLSAQTFTQVPVAPQFEGVENSSTAFSDVNGDDKPDVLITGRNNTGVHISKLYTQDGCGSFTEMPGTPFEGVSWGSIAFSDVNGDNKPDVLITGWNGSVRISKLYTNDGFGNFTEMMGTPFEGVDNGSIAFSDVNGDDKPDVLITGQKESGIRISKLYTNDGSGNFTEMIGTPFEGVHRSSIAFSDVNGDDKPDVFITGQNNSQALISKLYINDGLGNFTEMTGTPFVDVHYSSIAFSDVNGDDKPDVLITGQNFLGVRISKLYTNDGSGNFTEMTGTPFVGVYSGSIAFSDINGDDKPDVLITGQSLLGTQISKLYTNDGSGNFTEMTGTPFEGVEVSSIAFSDVNGDDKPDVLITGLNSLGVRISKLYTNDGSGNFTEMIGTPFEAVGNGSIAFSDVDNDGDKDVLITGGNSSYFRISKLYINDGLGNFTEMTSTPFVGVLDGSVAFSDVDNDGDKDALITGLNNSGVGISKLYTNDGLGNFTEMTGTPFYGMSNSSIAFSDVNGDGYEDVLMTGKIGTGGGGSSKLYTNDGFGNFIEKFAGTPFDGVFHGSIAFSDVDNDGDKDVLITGINTSFFNIAKLYINDGLGNFTEMTGTPFAPVSVGSIAFSDVDNDGDKDVLITGNGYSNYGGIISKLYTNDGLGNFTEMPGTPFVGVQKSSIAFSDVDNDGDKDVLITGRTSTFTPISKLYINDGFGNFTEMTGTPFSGVRLSSIAFSDVDNDGDKDVLITGLTSTFAPISKLYTNDGMVSSVADVSNVLSFEYVLYPNPTGAQQVNLSLQSKENGSVNIKVFDLNGRLLSQQQKQIGIGTQTFPIDISSLNKGSYIIQLDDGERTGVQKLLIQ